MSKIIRSMQDDLKEAEEGKKRATETKNNGEEKRDLGNLHDKMKGFSLGQIFGKDDDRDEENESKKESEAPQKQEEKPAPIEKKETVTTQKENPVQEKQKATEPQTTPAPQETPLRPENAQQKETVINKEEMSAIPQEKVPDQQKPEEETAVPEIKEEKEQQINVSKAEKVSDKQDEELKNLISRISGSMAGQRETSSENAQKAPTKSAPKPDKDAELKELLGRMSDSLKKDETKLKEEADKAIINTPESKTEIPEEKEDMIEDELSKKDSYWQDLHKTMKEQEKESEAETAEIIKEAAEETRTEPIIPKIKRPEASKEKSSAPKPTESVRPEPKIVIPQKPDRTEAEQQEKIQDQAGIIKPILDKKKEVVSSIKNHMNEGYVNPENRLIFGKQEYYSSIHKKIKARAQEDDLEKMEKTLKKDEKKLTSEEEKKMLRRQIIKKYQIKLYSLPWVRIIIFALLFLGTLGGTLYYILPKVREQFEQTETITYGSNIAILEEKITEEIKAKESAVAGINYFDAGVEPWTTLDNKATVRLAIEHDDEEAMISKEDALIALFGETNAGNIPQEIIDNTTESYGVVVFKNGNSMRLGLILSYEEEQDATVRSAMNTWATTTIADQKIYTIMKKLFLKDKVTETYITTFQTGTYNNTELQYVNLPDSATSMDYFIVNNMIVFTTSKDTTQQMIELLAQ